MPEVTPGDDERDTRLIGDLRALAARVDPVPPEVVAAARGSLTWRTIDADLAELVYDSTLDDREPVGVRGPGGPRVLTFEGPGLTVEVEVAAEGDDRRLVGQLVPAEAAVLEISHRGGTTRIRSDEHGRFAARDIRSGPVLIRCRRTGEGRPMVESDWTVM